jgi:hypothetical protein
LFVLPLYDVIVGESLLINRSAKVKVKTSDTAIPAVSVQRVDFLADNKILGWHNDQVALRRLRTLNYDYWPPGVVTGTLASQRVIYIEAMVEIASVA